MLRFLAFRKHGFMELTKLLSVLFYGESGDFRSYKINEAMLRYEN